MIAFVNNFDDLINFLSQELKDGNIPFCVARDLEDMPEEQKNNIEIEQLLCQEVIRDVGSEDSVSFLCIRTISIVSNLRGQGKFKEFFKAFDELPYPKMFQDVVNEELLNFLIRNGYTLLRENKYGLDLVSAYKL